MVSFPTRRSGRRLAGPSDDVILRPQRWEEGRIDRCVVEKKWLARNPLEVLKGIGKIRHGKEQLRIDEARKWMVEAHRQADARQAGAVAAMTALVMGMRASEIVSRVVRDLDDGGALLWIPDSKTMAGRRKLQVPEFLQPYLVELAEGRESSGGAVRGALA